MCEKCDYDENHPGWRTPSWVTKLNKEIYLLLEIFNADLRGKILKYNDKLWKIDRYLNYDDCSCRFLLAYRINEATNRVLTSQFIEVELQRCSIHSRREGTTRKKVELV